MEIKVKSAQISRIYLNMILQLTPESHCVRSLRVGTSLAHSTLPSFWSHISCFWRHFEAVLLETYSFMNNISDALSRFWAATLLYSTYWCPCTRRVLVAITWLVPCLFLPFDTTETLSKSELAKRQRPGQVSSNRSTASVFKALETSGQVPELSIRNLFFVKFLPIR